MARRSFRPFFAASLACALPAIVAGACDKPPAPAVAKPIEKNRTTPDLTEIKRLPVPDVVGGTAPVQQATSSFATVDDSSGIRHFRAINQRFLVTGTSARDTGVLIHETVTRDCCVEAERRDQSVIDLSGWTNGTGEGKPTWSTTFAADEGSLWQAVVDPFYVGTLYGCCDQSTLDKFVSVHTGRLSFFNTREAGGDPHMRDLPTAYDGFLRTSRYVAFHDMSTVSDPPEAKDASDLVGVLQYGATDEPAQRVIVRWTGDPSIQVRFNRLRFGISQSEEQRTLDVGSRSGALPEDRFGQFDVVLHIGVWNPVPADVVIRIPVRQDRLVTADAKVPRNFALGRETEKDKEKER